MKSLIKKILKESEEGEFNFLTPENILGLEFHNPTEYDERSIVYKVIQVKGNRILLEWDYDNGDSDSEWVLLGDLIDDLNRHFYEIKSDFNAADTFSELYESDIKPKLHVGDRVIVNQYVYNVDNEAGTIVEINEEHNEILIAFDTWDRGHDGNGDSICGDNKCLYLHPKDNIELLPDTYSMMDKLYESEDRRNFSVGDMVIVNEENVVDNEIGTIVYIDDTGLYGKHYLIEFDTWSKGHSAGVLDLCKKPGHCWWNEAKDMELAPDTYSMMDKLYEAKKPTKTKYSYLADSNLIGLKFRLDDKTYTIVENVNEYGYLIITYPSFYRGKIKTSSYKLTDLIDRLDSGFLILVPNDIKESEYKDYSFLKNGDLIGVQFKAGNNVYRIVGNVKPSGTIALKNTSNRDDYVTHFPLIDIIGALNDGDFTLVNDPGEIDLDSLYESDDLEWAEDILKEPIKYPYVGGIYRAAEIDGYIIDILITKIENGIVYDITKATVDYDETNIPDDEIDEFLEDYNKKDETDFSQVEGLILNNHWKPIRKEDSLFSGQKINESEDELEWAQDMFNSMPDFNIPPPDNVLRIIRTHSKVEVEYITKLVEYLHILGYKFHGGGRIKFLEHAEIITEYLNKGGYITLNSDGILNYGDAETLFHSVLRRYYKDVPNIFI
jgi:hypothetical protein